MYSLKYAKYVIKLEICQICNPSKKKFRICTPHFADVWHILDIIIMMIYLPYDIQVQCHMTGRCLVYVTSYFKFEWHWQGYTVTRPEYIPSISTFLGVQDGVTVAGPDIMIGIPDIASGPHIDTGDIRRCHQMLCPISTPISGVAGPEIGIPDIGPGPHIEVMIS